jgi:hypothetical protein
MRAPLAVLLAVTTSAIAPNAAPEPVAARMHHVRFHLGYGAVLNVDDLRGGLTAVKAGPPTFDDVESYRVDISYALVSMTPDSLANLMNRYVFVRAEAPLKNLAVRIEDNELVQTGSLKKGISVPFTMHATIGLTEDGRLRLHPTSLKAAGFIGKRVLDFFGLELERLVKTKRGAGMTIEGDDLLLDPEQMLPPPRIHGRLAKVWLRDGALFLEFGDPRSRGITPPIAEAVNYMYYRGGTLRFGKLTMQDADLLLVDEDPRDPFDFSPAEYNRQLVAGYSNNTESKGLIVHMPDADKASKGARAVATSGCR